MARISKTLHALTKRAAAPAWQSMAVGGSSVAASAKPAGGRNTATGTSANNRKPNLVVPSTLSDTVGGWGAEDTDEDRPQGMQVTCDIYRVAALST